MAARVLPVLSLAVLIPLAACDVSQTPRTTTVRTGSAAGPVTPQQGSLSGSLGSSIQAPVEAYGGGATEGERSLRLYGPGVSRKAQTRI